MEGWLLVLAAVALDRLVGDPRRWLHPVVVMGWWITRLRRWVEAWAGDVPWRLRLGGGLITAVLVGGSGLAGWGLERWSLAGLSAGGWWAGGGLVLLTVALASALAGRSLEQAVLEVLQLLPPAGTAASALPQADPLEPARRQLAWIVGRDTGHLDRAGILRALAETASENGVDGQLAPLFWMLVGAALWSGPGNPAGGLALPGPLALAWSFKAASTLDSMLGYRTGRLRWLGTAGARLDDLLVWLPCRLTAATLPLVAGRPWRAVAVLRAALWDGRSDPSPNAGVSQAAYAWLLGVRLGGLNHYGGQPRPKPLLAGHGRPADAAAVRGMLALTARLSWLWLAAAWLVAEVAARVVFITKTLS